MKKLQRLMALLLISVVCQGAMAQGTSTTEEGVRLFSSNDANHGSLNNNMISLAEYLSILEQEFDVTFLFKNELLVNKYINQNAISEKDRTGQRLSQILNKLEISFQRIDEQTYVLLDKEVSLPAVQVQEEITGTITDSQTGETLPGVNILVKGTTTGASTDQNGSFELTVPSLQDTLVVTYIGYQEQEVPINGQTQLDIQMTPQAIMGEEMVVVGYGTQQRGDVTGAVSSISGSDLEERTITNPEIGLQGLSPGLTIQNQGGQPGEENAVTRIRGTGTLNNANPLVLVDGVEQSLSTLEPSAIESISVLKDAASAAIYGSRAANGVILVTTKRGAESGMNIQYQTHVGVQNLLGWPEPASKEDWLRLENEAQVNAGGSPTYSEEYIDNVVAGTNPLEYPFAEWEEGVFQDNALEQSHALSVSTGSDIGRIYADVNYTNTDGIIQNFNNQKTSIRLNSDLYLTDKLTAKANILYRNRDVSGPGFPPNTITQGILHVNRNVIMSFPDGQKATGELPLGGQFNSFIMANSGEATRFSNDIVGTAGVTYQFNNNLSLEGEFTANITGTDESIFRESRNNMTHYVTGDPIAASDRFATNTLQEGRYSERELTQRLLMNYEQDLEFHSLSGLVGFEQIYNNTEQFSAGRADFFNNDLRSLTAGDSGTQRTCQAFNEPGEYTNGCYKNEWLMRSFFGRVNYTYDGRYSLQANIRYDGSSRFAEGSRWGVFPSFSAGWEMSNESFMSDIDEISTLKLRASWGQLGNERIGLFQFMNMYNLNQSYQFNNSVAQGAAVTDAGNPNISWETTTMTNVGLDLGFIDNRLEIVAEYFWNYTEDILLDLPIPSTIGVNPPTQNAAEVSNKGWELQVNYQSEASSNGFQYSIGINMADVVNEIESLSGEGPFYPDKFTVWKEGESINALRGFRSPGIYRSQEDLDKYPTKISQSAGMGDIIFEDLNGDGILSQSLVSDGGDQIIVGNEDPRYEFGINLGASYRRFNLSMFWQGVLQQYHMLDGALMEGPNWQNYIPDVMARETYHPERNPEGSWPLVTAGNTWNLYETDFWLQDTKYVRLKNIQLGYRIPQGIVQDLQLFVSGDNILTFTPTELFDPETPRGRSQFFPHSKKVSVGLNVTF